MSENDEFPRPLTAEEAKARKKRNQILAFALVVFMGLVLLITITRLKDGVVRDQDWEAETGGSQSDTVRAGEGAPPLEDGDGDE